MPTFQEEPGLFDVFQPLVQRWKLLLVGVSAGILIAALVTVVSTKQYETTMLLQVGAILDKQIEDSSTVVEIINSDSFHQTISNRLGLNSSSKQMVKMIRAETNSNTSRYSPLVTVTVLSDSPAHAVDLEKAIFALLNERHKPMFDAKMEYYIVYEKQLDDKIKIYEQELMSLKRDLKSLDSDPKSSLADKLLLEARIGDRETDTLSAKRELRELMAYSSPVHSHATAMVATPVLPRKPTKPNLRLNLVIAFLSSLFLMVSFILILDQYKRTSLRI
jgi:uncharacterized protein involved in exopolysaccharide biosynthesis